MLYPAGWNEKDARRRLFKEELNMVAYIFYHLCSITYAHFAKLVLNRQKNKRPDYTGIRPDFKVAVFLPGKTSGSGSGGCSGCIGHLALTAGAVPASAESVHYRNGFDGCIVRIIYNFDG